MPADSKEERMKRLWDEVRGNIKISNYVCKSDESDEAFQAALKKRTERTLKACRRTRSERLASIVPTDISDRTCHLLAPLTDHLPLEHYEQTMFACPRLVNVVTLAEAIPVPGSKATLPLNLHHIAAHCRNAYYAPKRFAAVQLAFTDPRCRVLVFHTGRLVGTGCSGPMAARLSIMRAARQLREEADVAIHVRNFQIINQVGAVSIGARLNCDLMAQTHSSTSHYDKQSFVGLAWRPEEIYSTGRANLPGSTRQRDLLLSFARMVPELWRNGDGAHLLGLVKNEADLIAHLPVEDADVDTGAATAKEADRSDKSNKSGKAAVRYDVALGSGKRKRKAEEHKRKKSKEASTSSKALWDDNGDDDDFFAGGLKSTFALNNTEPDINAANGNDDDDQLLLNAGF